MTEPRVPAGLPTSGALPPPYPFSAVVGQEDLKRALLVAAVAPDVGGVLVQGERGTAKSTAVRGLAALLPPVPTVAGCPLGCDPAAPFAFCPHCGGRSCDGPPALRPPALVDLPVGATEDRVLGHLDLEAAVRDGHARFAPGLLARAHRGILYVDEVNLLPDHLVDLLLDAAAGGRVTVERDGLSVSHPARFLLVGTMNPDEGELRPQLLDRFGLAVEVLAPSDPELRGEVVRRRIGYERDPAGFAAAWAPAEAELAARLRAAHSRLPGVRVGEAELSRIVGLALERGAEGLRGDLTTFRAACAIAALAGRDAVTEADVETAAVLALLHRQRPEAPPGTPPPTVAPPPGGGRRPPPPPPPPPAGAPASQAPPRLGSGPAEAGGEPSGPQGVGSAVQPYGSDPAPVREDARAPARVAPLGRSPGGLDLRPGPPVAARRPVSARGAGGGRPRLQPYGPGPCVRAAPWHGGALAVAATLRAALPRRPWRGATSLRLPLAATDLQQTVRRVRPRRLILFLVDASGSMGVRRRMETTKAAVLAAVAAAYRRRDRVALMSFRGAGAELVLPPTNSVPRARARLAALATGGRTPLGAGLAAAGAYLAACRRRVPEVETLLVVFSDGRANAAPAGQDPLRHALAAAARLLRAGVRSVVVDTEDAGFPLGLARRLAEALGAGAGAYRRLDELRGAPYRRDP